MKFFGIVTALCVCFAVFAQDSADDVLNYVDGSASWIAYGNTAFVLQHKIWSVAERITRQAGEYHKVMNRLNKEIGISPEDAAGEVIVWGDDQGARGVVVRLARKNAHQIFDKIARAKKRSAQKRSGRVVLETVSNGYRLMLCGWKYKEDVRCEFSMLVYSDEILQFFIEEAHVTPFVPRRRNPLVEKIDRSKVASVVVSGALIKNVTEPHLRNALPYGMPAIGDITLIIEADNDKVRVLAEADISNLQ